MSGSAVCGKNDVFHESFVLSFKKCRTRLWPNSSIRNSLNANIHLGDCSFQRLCTGYREYIMSHKQTRILLLPLHLPVIHVEALSHSRSNITLEYIAALVPVLDSVLKRRVLFSQLPLFAANEGTNGRTDLYQQWGRRLQARKAYLSQVKKCGKHKDQVCKLSQLRVIRVAMKCLYTMGSCHDRGPKKV